LKLKRVVVQCQCCIKCKSLVIANQDNVGRFCEYNHLYM